jgi:CcmD family protein
MEKNFWWLFASYAVIWGALFVFVMQLLSRQAKLRREVNHLLRGRGQG